MASSAPVTWPRVEYHPSTGSAPLSALPISGGGGSWASASALGSVSRSAALPVSAAASPVPLMQQMRRDFQQDVHEACMLVDQGRKGYITARELKYVFVACMGFKPSKLEIHNMLSGDPATARGILTYAQVCLLLQRKQLYQPADDVLRHLFRALDSQQRGFIVMQDLIDAAADFAPHIPLTTLCTAFAAADLDHNRKIGWAEFQRVMTYTPGAISAQQHQPQQHAASPVGESVAFRGPSAAALTHGVRSFT